LRPVSATSFALFAIAIATVSNLAQAATAAAEAAVGNAVKGRELFVTNGCFACHGYAGQGGNAGARLAPDPLPWQAIAVFIRNPRNYNPPAVSTQVMPPFTSKMVSDRDVQDIYAYLKTVPGPTDIKNIPTFRK
jgi:mono/diheme cytochrome c family protein